MKIKGYVDSFSYRNPDSSFGIFTFVSEELEEGELKCVGPVYGLDEGDYLEVDGIKVVHPTYGPQIKMSSFRILPPDESRSALKYLSSGAIKGIGPVLALRIFHKFKDDTFRILDEEPEMLAQISGISERMARNIGVQVAEKRDLREAMIYLAQFGISNSMAAKIYKRYKTDLYRIFKENPYKLAEDIRGIGFKTADEIADKAGIAKNAPGRIRGGIIYCLGQNELNGNTCMDKSELRTNCAELMNLSEEEVENCFIPLIMEQKIVIRSDMVFLAATYRAELYAASKLKSLQEIFEHTDVRSRSKVSKKVEDLCEKENLSMDEVQKDAVVAATETGVFILTGGPGTGKTTTIKAMIRYFDEQGKEVFLCAPTGRAAKRMEEATGYEAKTIHRLLEVSGSDGEDEEVAVFGRCENNPLEADVIIVDEVSMVDVFLFKALLAAVPEGCRLILSGDAAQLPSVGPGNVLKDLLRTGLFTHVTLEKIYRQAQGGDIVANADLIRRGISPEWQTDGEDFFFVPRERAETVCRDLVLLMKERIPAKFKIPTRQIQVLTPMKAGNLGVQALNALLQQELNPPAPGKNEMKRGDVTFRLGDKVMQIKNNYDAKWNIRGINEISIADGEGIFNGDTGIITSVSLFDKSLVVRFDDDREVEYEKDMLDELELAYAVTIHKSQGSEYPAVILPLLDGPRMLFNRNLLYTAVTRGTKCVMVLGLLDTLEKMVHTDGEQRRLTGFGERLKEVFADGG